MYVSLLLDCKGNGTSCLLLPPLGTHCHDGLYSSHREPEIIPFLELFFVRYFITAMIKVTNPAGCSLVALSSSHGQFYYLVSFT